MKKEVAELTPQYLFSLIEKNTGKIEALERSQSRTSRTVKDIEEEYPLLPPEADDLANAVKRRGAWVLGGKKSNAYKNVTLRRNVYRDIYGEMKRQYGLIDDMGRQKSYKKLKRKYLNGALAVVEEYELPISLQNQVDEENDIDFED
jgi:hypothetical protein